MKKLTIIIILAFISTCSFAQERTEFGISTEASWFIPHRKDRPYSNNQDFANKSGFGTGIGVYASRNLFGRVSGDVGLSYRYKQMEQYYKIYTGEGGYDDAYDGTSYGYGYSYASDYVDGWDKLPMHHFVVPVNLQLLLGKSFFIKGGIEATWLLNYEAVNEKPEFNWVLGFGSQKHKLKWSVNYIRGFKEQGFGDGQQPDGHYKGSINRNNMVQVKLSYPIWQF